MRKQFLSLFFIFLGYSYFAQSQPSTKERIQQHYQKAIQSYKDKAYKKYLYHTQVLDSLRPCHPAILHNLASAYALTRQQDKAIKYLKRLILIRADKTSLTQEKDFENIKNTDAFKSVLTAIDALNQPVLQSKVAFTLKEKDAHIEGIAYDAKTGNFYVSSIRKRKVIQISSEGKVQDFLTSGQDGLWGVSGVQIDSKNRVLWLTTSIIPQMEGFKKEDEGKTAIFKYNLDDRKLLKKYILKAKGVHFFGDLTLNSKGDVYITDSYYPAIYRIRPGYDQLELFLKTHLRSLQGLTFSQDEKYLFFADYSSSLYRVDLATKTWLPLSHPAEILPKMIDGLYFYKNSLIAIQNGTIPKRIVRYHLDNSLEKITHMDFLESNNSKLQEPTLGVIVKNQFYYVGNSPWTKYDEKGKLLPLEQLDDLLIMQLNLK